MSIKHVATKDKKPDPKYVAKQVVRLLVKKPLPKAVKNDPEPYRAAMYHLGFEAEDGTDWWDAVMRILS